MYIIRRNKNDKHERANVNDNVGMKEKVNIFICLTPLLAYNRWEFKHVISLIIAIVVIFIINGMQSKSNGNMLKP